MPRVGSIPRGYDLATVGRDVLSSMPFIQDTEREESPAAVGVGAAAIPDVDRIQGERFAHRQRVSGPGWSFPIGPEKQGVGGGRAIDAVASAGCPVCAALDSHRQVRGVERLTLAMKGAAEEIVGILHLRRLHATRTDFEPPYRGIRGKHQHDSNVKLGDMKRYLSAFLAATLITITACGSGGSVSPGETSTPEATQAATSAKPPKVVPDVAGKPYPEASKAFTSMGFRTTVPIGPDGKRWVTLNPGNDVLAVSSDPASGASTTEESAHITVNRSEEDQRSMNIAANEAILLKSRYTYKCGSYDASAPTLRSYQEVWTSKYYAGSATCSVEIDGKHPSTKQPLFAREQALIDLIASKGGDVSLPTATVGEIMLMYAKVSPDFADQFVARMDWRRADIEGALSVCPDAPHAGVLREALTAVKVFDGTKVVGKDMEPGTYKTKANAKDCYWSRTTGGGNIIANDFVGFAPDGVMVTVYPGEGFESQRCGTWTKIG